MSRAPTPRSARSSRGGSAPANSGRPASSANPSEAFSRAIASSEPRCSRCALPALVMTAAPGRASAARNAISPGRFIAISTTAARCAGSSRSSVSGTPQWLLRFPSVFSVAALLPSTAATRSLVALLPALPVTHSISPVQRSRQRAATAASPAVTSSTTTSGPGSRPCHSG